MKFTRFAVSFFLAVLFAAATPAAFGQEKSAAEKQLDSILVELRQQQAKTAATATTALKRANAANTGLAAEVAVRKAAYAHATAVLDTLASGLQAEATARLAGERQLESSIKGVEAGHGARWWALGISVLALLASGGAVAGVFFPQIVGRFRAEPEAGTGDAASDFSPPPPSRRFGSE